MTLSDTLLSMTQVTSPLTAAEVAERLGVERQTVNDWARDGKIPAITLPSGRKRFRVADIEAIERGDNVNSPHYLTLGRPE